MGYLIHHQGSSWLKIIGDASKEALGGVLVAGAFSAITYIFSPPGWLTSAVPRTTAEVIASANSPEGNNVVAAIGIMAVCTAIWVLNSNSLVV